MITQRDLDLWSERQKSARDSEQEAGARSLELRKRSNDLQKKTYTKWINSFLNEVPIDFNMPLLCDILLISSCCDIASLIARLGVYTS